MRRLAPESIGLGATDGGFVQVHFERPAAALVEPRARAASTRMRRIICAARAKNCARSLPFDVGHVDQAEVDLVD